jgi:hypothetical protein
LTREKVDGTTISVPIHPSKVQITNLVLDDKWRKQIVERRQIARREMEAVAEKPARKPPKKLEVEKEVAEEKPVAIEEKPKKPRKRVAKKPAKRQPKEKTAEEAEKAEVEEEKPKPRKPRTKRNIAKKTGGE